MGGLADIGWDGIGVELGTLKELLLCLEGFGHVLKVFEAGHLSGTQPACFLVVAETQNKGSEWVLSFRNLPAPIWERI